MLHVTLLRILIELEELAVQVTRSGRVSWFALLCFKKDETPWIWSRGFYYTGMCVKEY